MPAGSKGEGGAHHVPPSRAFTTHSRCGGGRSEMGATVQQNGFVSGRREKGDGCIKDRPPAVAFLYPRAMCNLLFLLPREKSIGEQMLCATVVDYVRLDFFLPLFPSASVTLCRFLPLSSIPSVRPIQRSCFHLPPSLFFSGCDFFL